MNVLKKDTFLERDLAAAWWYNEQLQLKRAAVHVIFHARHTLWALQENTPFSCGDDDAPRNRGDRKSRINSGMDTHTHTRDLTQLDWIEIVSGLGWVLVSGNQVDSWRPVILIHTSEPQSRLIRYWLYILFVPLSAGWVIFSFLKGSKNRGTLIFKYSKMLFFPHLWE